MSKKVPESSNKLEKALEHLKDILPHVKDQALFWGLMYVTQANYENPRFKLTNMLGSAIALESLKNSDPITALAAKGYLAGQLAVYQAKTFFKKVDSFDVDTTDEVDKWRVAIEMKYGVLP